ncbi:response regulator [Paenibacillus sp. IB182496]|uniref:Response regulator n=2 Tax=Paenibacillus sabuli TaxID=2772509 RepID=A0A927GSU7_9BACL|nr:response regulator [Paenibacillus sabuli]
MKVLLVRSGEYEIVGSFTSPIEALSAMAQLKPDVVFVDVEMPRMSGLELARRLQGESHHSEIVFTTAHAQYALGAFDVAALDYILKPVTPQEIRRVTERLGKRRSRPSEAAAPAQPRIRCFGPFEVRSSKGALVRFRTRKVEEMFAYLLCHPNRTIRKWVLIELLWPEADEEKGSQSLYNTIYLLKKTLKSNELGMELTKLNDGYALVTGDVRYDALELQQGETGPLDEEQAERTCALYRGPLFEGKPYPWKLAADQAYSNRYEELMQEQIVRRLEREDWKRAADLLEAYLARFPLDEEQAERLIDVYLAQGSPDKAAGYYARFCRLYRQELELEPPETIRRKAASSL